MPQTIFMINLCEKRWIWIVDQRLRYKTVNIMLATTRVDITTVTVFV
jgi:hypothetical protein